MTHLAKVVIWRTESLRYALLKHTLWDLGRQLPGCYGKTDVANLDFSTQQVLLKAAWERFEALDMFFVKVRKGFESPRPRVPSLINALQLSDFLYTVPNIPHLRNVRLGVEYRELLENESQLIGWQTMSKWKNDPGVERFHGFAPRFKYYVNGIMVGEELPTPHQTSPIPFPERRVPRRGLVQVFPDDPEYERICLEQGLDHLVIGSRTPSVSNGLLPSPTTATARSLSRPHTNGTSKLTNGELANGTHDTLSANKSP